MQVGNVMSVLIRLPTRYVLGGQLTQVFSFIRSFSFIFFFVVNLIYFNLFTFLIIKINLYPTEILYFLNSKLNYFLLFGKKEKRKFQAEPLRASSPASKREDGGRSYHDFVFR